MVSLIIASLVILALYVGTKRLSGFETLGVVLIALAGIVLAIFPVLSTWVASFLHVGRGTDLIFYLAVLAGLFVVSNFYVRFKRHEETLIALARRNAIDNAQEPKVEPTQRSMTQRD